jgi:hypothetical protein
MNTFYTRWSKLLFYCCTSLLLRCIFRDFSYRVTRIVKPLKAADTTCIRAVCIASFVSLDRDRSSTMNLSVTRCLNRPFVLPPVIIVYIWWVSAGLFGKFVSQAGKFQAATGDAEKSRCCVAPDNLLQLVRCSFNAKCSLVACSCRTHGLHCLSACKNCRGTDWLMMGVVMAPWWMMMIVIEQCDANGTTILITYMKKFN